MNRQESESQLGEFEKMVLKAEKGKFMSVFYEEQKNNLLIKVEAQTKVLFEKELQKAYDPK
jgi:hypothetical protein